MPARVDPAIPAEHEQIPKKVLQEIRALLERPEVFVWTSFGGLGMGQTKDRKIAERLIEGWEIGKDENQAPVFLRFASMGEFTKARGGDAYYEFRVPAALIGMVREMHDKRDAA